MADAWFARGAKNGSHLITSKEIMPVPTYDEFIEPLLRYLAGHSDGAAIADAYEALADALRLSAEDRAELLPSGAQPVYKNRIGWAHDRSAR